MCLGRPLSVHGRGVRDGGDSSGSMARSARSFVADIPVESLIALPGAAPAPLAAAHHHGGPSVILGTGDAFGVAALFGDDTGAVLQASGTVHLLVLSAEDLRHPTAEMPKLAAALVVQTGGRESPLAGSRLS